MSSQPASATVYVEKTSPEQQRKRPPHEVEGWGADLEPQTRPAYPRERTPPRFISPHWDELEQQAPTVTVYHSIERPGLTPVFGTAQPPSGVSGLIRGAAFRYSENDLRHWLMLMFADRINVVEGLLDDLVHGHIPNVFREMGGRAEWRYNRVGFYRKAAIAGTAVLLVAFLTRRRRRR
jgi:hypothetical protein